MRINQVMMELARKHAPVGSADYADLNNEIESDYAKIQFSKEFEENNPELYGFRNKIKRFCENPYSRLFFIFLYWWLFRKIGDWKNGSDLIDKEKDF